MASTSVDTSAVARVAPRSTEIIDRSRTIWFTFNGKKYPAHPGDTIASALTANGVKVVARSFKYHRPRGLMAYGHAMNTMVQIGNEPSVSAWLRPVKDGMQVKSVNAWPSVDFDIMSATSLGDRFLPVGFYYKTFIRPTFMWPLYESVLRRIAGLGKIDTEAKHPGGYDKQYVHADIVIVGGGPAGLSAAITAAGSGLRVALFDDNATLGGHLRFHPEEADRLTEMRRLIANHANITPYNNTTVLGWYDHNWLSAVRNQRLFKIRTKQVIFATGAIDQPLVFDNNDLPGIMLGSGVRRLLHLYGATAGEQALIVTANDDGWQVAADLIDAGIDVVAVVDQRDRSESEIADRVEHSGIPVFWRHTIVAAEGRKEVTGAAIAPVNENGRVNRAKITNLNCDLVSISMAWAPDNGLLYQAGARMSYDEDRKEFLPTSFPDSIHAAGRVMGTHSLANEILEGHLAAARALQAMGVAIDEDLDDLSNDLTVAKTAEPVRTSDLVHVAGDGKQFVDLDEDVTYKDIKTAIGEGFSSIELLKRYSTVSMGPSQGKWSSINTIHLTSRINDWTIPETGTTTSRPPYRPVEMAALGGQMMEPIKYTPLHDWHIQHGATMMAAGLWMRPEHYGDVTGEVKAVRTRVGLIDVSTLGKLKFTGPGTPELLNKLYINKWMKLREGRVRYGVMCNSEGVITDDGVTARVGENEWYMSTTSSGAQSVLEWAQWWMQSGWGDGVQMTSVTDGRAAFNLAGPRSRQVLAMLTDADISNEAFPYMHVRDVELAGVSCRLMRIGFTGELSYEIHCPAGYAQYVWEQLMAAGEEFGITPFGVEAQRTLRLEKAHIIVGQDTDALSDPISADMSWAVKLDKPDFLGQRPLSRLADSGPAQKLVGFKMVAADILPEEGLQIVRDRPGQRQEIIGWVTSSRYSPTLGENIGLCWLPTDVAEQVGAKFTIRREGDLIEGEVFHGAFYDPEGLKLQS